MWLQLCLNVELQKYRMFCKKSIQVCKQNVEVLPANSVMAIIRCSLTVYSLHEQGSEASSATTEILNPIFTVIRHFQLGHRANNLQHSTSIDRTH
jgi:tRNA pseudouridine-54 N-methylase